MSIQRYARLAGLLYLINIILGIFAIGYMPSVILTNDVVTTAKNLREHEQLFRLAFAAHIVILLTNIPLSMIFWKLFHKVSSAAALMIVFFCLVGTAVETANLFNQYMALITLTAKTTLSPEQHESLSFLYNRLQVRGVHVGFIFFGFYLLCIGYAVIKSLFIPKVFGMLTLLGGACYIFYSFSMLLSPAFAASLDLYLQIPSALSEFSFTCWLLIVGVNVRKWKERFGSVEG